MKKEERRKGKEERRKKKENVTWEGCLVEFVARFGFVFGSDGRRGNEVWKDEKMKVR